MDPGKEDAARVKPIPTVEEQMRYRLGTAASVSFRPRCRAVRVCATCVAPFPVPRACVGPRGPRDSAVSPARGSAGARHRPRSGVSSAVLDVDRGTRYFCLSFNATSMTL